MNNAHSLLIDCDTGIDDALALLYLALDPSVDIRAVTTVGGNIDPLRAADNSGRVLRLAGRGDVPVHVGAEHTLGAARHEYAPEIHGHNGLGDVELPELTPFGERPAAAEELVRLARRSPGRHHLLALGPLTNLANALRLEPRLPELLAGITVMGGAIRRQGNATPRAEANVHNDPEAARTVLHAGGNLTLVPLDVTMTETLDEAAHAELVGANSPVTDFAAAILAYYLDFYETRYGSRRAACHDPLAAAIAVGDLAEVGTEELALDVRTLPGPERGATVLDTRSEHSAGGHSPTVRVVTRTSGTFGTRLCERLRSADARTYAEPAVHPRTTTERR
ncbi:purine nucleosidase [Actinopolyspora lacussalsi subsp. righensis]|uniref:Purine nucleosidase n=1 Tax=Actinopolyspora righensis TaxID=995060 RepID=A0A1I6X8M1_9ACTN|nr:nucleoside hydrolase [Actinopolyspora righensis]SFT34134.1 purine nucleosidase [Actinopolyspora righensis]